MPLGWTPPQIFKNKFRGGQGSCHSAGHPPQIFNNKFRGGQGSCHSAGHPPQIFKKKFRGGQGSCHSVGHPPRFSRKNLKVVRDLSARLDTPQKKQGNDQGNSTLSDPPGKKIMALEWWRCRAPEFFSSTLSDPDCPPSAGGVAKKRRFLLGKRPGLDSPRCTRLWVYLCTGILVYRCASVPVLQCIGIPVYLHSCTSASVFQCTVVPTFWCTRVSVSRGVGVPVYRYTSVC